MTRRSKPAAIRLAGALAILATTGDAKAAVCPIPNVDLSAALRALPGTVSVLKSRRRDPDADEPILRHIVEGSRGATIVLEQQNCRISNVRVTVLSRTMPDDADLRRMGAVLGITPLWRRYFRGRNAATSLAREPQSAEFRANARSTDFSYPADARFSASGANSEAIVSFHQTPSYAVPYRHMLTLYIGVGGE